MGMIDKISNEIKELSGEDIIRMAADLLVAHEVYHHVRYGSDEQLTRLISMAGLGSMGYIFGPAIAEKLHIISGKNDSTEDTKKAISAIGGALLGGTIGYFGTKALVNNNILPGKQDPPELPQGLEDELRELAPKPEKSQRMRAAPILMLAGLYLGARFIRNNDQEQRTRLICGLGGSAIGYLAGPSILAKMRINTPGAKDEITALFEQTKTVYRRSEFMGMIVGASAGGIAGWYKGPDLVQLVLRDKADHSAKKNSE